MCVALYDDHPTRCAHHATVATFPTWDVETYSDDCEVDSWSKLLIPHGGHGGDPNYICDCPVVYDDETHEPLESGFHTAECWDRYELWLHMGATPWCDDCLQPEAEKCHSGECLDYVEMCGRCGLPEHVGTRCDVPCDAGWLVEHPHTWPKNQFAWKYSDDGKGWWQSFEEEGWGDVFDALGNAGSELPPQRGEPEECRGVGCQRGNCCWCKEAADYWAFCSSSHCFYHNCGEPFVRIDGANVNENGETICSGCAVMEPCITSSRISPN
jgi:hypothetical protein